MNIINYVITKRGVSVFTDDGKSFDVGENHISYSKIKAALKEKDFEKVAELIDTRKIIETMFSDDGTVVFEGNNIKFDGYVLTTGITKRIIRLINENEGDVKDSVRPLLNFLARLMNNPDNRVVNELFGFLDANDLPFTEDGHFLAYKRVRVNSEGKLVDCHTGTYDNSVGEEVSMRRNMVDTDKTKTCSHGLHAASWDYAKDFYSSGDDKKMIVVKIDPADVVSVPVDYNNQKLRVCRYVVLSEHDETSNTLEEGPVVNNQYWGSQARGPLNPDVSTVNNDDVVDDENEVDENDYDPETGEFYNS